MDVIKAMRERLVPQGTVDLIRLGRGGDAGYYSGEEVRGAIDCLERKIKIASLGEKLNPLELIAVSVLMNTAEIQL
jgi:hypothetical protein